MPRKSQGPYLSDDRNEAGFYEVRWTENGRSKRKSTGKADRRAAQRYYAEFIIALDGAVANDGQITVGQCIDAYLKDKTEVMAPNTQRNDYGHLRTHFGDLVVTEIDEDDVQAYREARAAGQITFVDAEGKIRGGKKSGDSTVRRELSMLSTAINHAIDKKKFRDSQGRPLLKPGDRPHIELPAAPSPRDRWLSRDEAGRLLTAAAEVIPATGEDPGRLPRVYRYIALMLYTAARKETVYRLTWDRIQIQEDPERVAAGDYGMINFQDPGRKRTKKRRGWVPIGAELHPILVRAKREATGPHFLDRPLEPRHPFRAAAKRAKVDKVSPHVLRHTWATWAAQDGVSLFEIAGVLHDTLATVEKNYAHHCPEHLRGAVNRRMLAA